MYLSLSPSLSLSFSPFLSLSLSLSLCLSLSLSPPPSLPPSRAQHELLVQLLSSLGDKAPSSSSSVSSLESQPHSVATETGDVAGLVREILLKEALGFYQMKEETESHQDEVVYDYSNSSFESESVTPIATPSPTPPSTPPTPKEAVPVEHTPQVTPTGSLTALTFQKEEEELSTPQVQLQ